MIAPDFRVCAPNPFEPHIKKFVLENHGDDLWTSLCPSIQEVDKMKHGMSTVQQYKADSTQLQKFRDMFLKNYQNSKILNKYFSFVPNKT